MNSTPILPAENYEMMYICYGQYIPLLDFDFNMIGIRVADMIRLMEQKDPNRHAYLQIGIVRGESKRLWRYPTKRELGVIKEKFTWLSSDSFKLKIVDQMLSLDQHIRTRNEIISNHLKYLNEIYKVLPIRQQSLFKVKMESFKKKFLDLRSMVEVEPTEALFYMDHIRFLKSLWLKLPPKIYREHKRTWSNFLVQNKNYVFHLNRAWINNSALVND